MKSSCQKGTTLLEAIGVLSILGLMTIGAVRGYEKILSEYRLNKMVKSLVRASTRIRKLYTWQKTYDELSLKPNLNSFLCDEDVYTTECQDNGPDKKLVHEFGGGIAVTSAGEEFKLTYGGLTAAQCTKIASQNLNLTAIKIGSSAVKRNPTYQQMVVLCAAQLSGNCPKEGCDHKKFSITFYFR